MKQLLFLALFISCFLTSNVLDDLIIKKNPTINMILIELLASGLREETSSTKYSESIPKEICLAGGVNKDICTGRYGNRAPKNIEEAIDMIPYKDRNYWWDRFKDQYGNYQWRCRGGQTKQFAENSKCSGVSKDDDRWPG